jgi:hypothetical protein
MGLPRRIRPHSAAVGVYLALLWIAPSTVWARLEQPASTIDLTRFTSTSPTIVRGVVVGVTAAREIQGLAITLVAQLRVQRWYRGGDGPNITVQYEAGVRMPGHNCIDFRPGAYWLIFATERDGHSELVDDCYGAVAVSRVIAPSLRNPDVLAQMEADFIAGLDDPGRAGRLLSIQRLGGLKLASSRPALHGVIEHGNSEEKDWATYAALRTGDTSVLARARAIVARGGSRNMLHFCLAWEMDHVKDRPVMPGQLK